MDKSSAEFTYPENGRNGKNILANSILNILKGEKVSLKAVIPPNDKLVVEIQGPKPVDKDDNGASWVFSIGKKRNWISKTYESNGGGRQEFDAESGSADMELEFQRSGDVIISVFEGNKRDNSWTNTLKVRELELLHLTV